MNIPSTSTTNPRARRETREEIVIRKLRKLEEKKGYPVIRQNAQRVCGPPTTWNKPIPASGSEIFVGHIPRWLIEDELMEIFSEVGIIYMIRVVVDVSGYNRGFAFITYENPDQARIAVERLNNFEIRPNCVLGVCKSVDNRRLFIGGISEDKNKQDVQMVLECHVEDLTDIIMYPPTSSNQNGRRCNRGYIFAEFGSHRSAVIAKRLLSGGVKLWEDAAVPVSVNWADPIPEVDRGVMETVKRLYIRNLPYDLTTEQLQLHLVQHVRLSNITKVHKINDYAFIHFQTKAAAQMALSVLNGLIMWGREIEATWSRPQMYSKECQVRRVAENFCRSLPPRMRQPVQILRNGAPPGRNSETGTPSLAISV